MVWGCFSIHGISPINRIKEMMTASSYNNISSEVMLPYAGDNIPLPWVYQQDNDPKHTSNRVKKLFSDNNISILSWPAQTGRI